MTVSDKMIEASQRSAGSATAFHADQVLQAGVNAAWTRFDPEDESTWPNSSLAPSGMPWLVENHEQGDTYPEIGCDEWLVKEKDWLMCFNSIHYADPATLMPK